jgi:hypothetical protein
MTYSIDTRQAFARDKRPPIQSLSEIKAVEISFEEHEIYAGERAIAKIIYDDSDFITQPWMVIINGLEIHRVSTWAICYNYITWHFKQRTLPQQQEEIATVDYDIPVPRRVSQKVRTTTIALLYQYLFPSKAKNRDKSPSLQISFYAFKARTI